MSNAHAMYIGLEAALAAKATDKKEILISFLSSEFDEEMLDIFVYHIKKSGLDANLLVICFDEM